MSFIGTLLIIGAVIAIMLEGQSTKKAQRNRSQATQDMPPEVLFEEPSEGEWSEFAMDEPDIPDASHEGMRAFSPEGVEPVDHDHGLGLIRPLEIEETGATQPRLTAAKVREAFILSEVLSPPVSQRRRATK